MPATSTATASPTSSSALPTATHRERTSFWGSAAGLQPVPVTRLVPGDTTGSTFGASVAIGGDVNGDGFADVVIGDPSYGAFGVAYFYLGGSSGIGVVPSVTLVGIESGGNFGNAVAIAGDLDGDGLSDLVIGASNVENGVGRVYLYIGDPMIGVSSFPSVTFVGIDAGLSYYGNVVASAESARRWLRDRTSERTAFQRGFAEASSRHRGL